MKVAVVGGGLVGRLAAWAAMLSGHTPTIFDRMATAVAPRGFVFLHEPCSLPLTPQAITVIMSGPLGEKGRRAYAKKVYDNVELADQVSFEKYKGTVLGYDPAEALSILNGLQHGMVQDVNFETLDEVKLLLETHERVVFTLPINKFVPGIWLSKRGSVGVYPLDAGEKLRNFCVYSSDPNIPWCRAGAMFGFAFREFSYVVPGHRVIEKVVEGPRPQVVPHHAILFTGRFGKWTKQLAHESFEETLNWLS